MTKWTPKSRTLAKPRSNIGGTDGWSFCFTKVDSETLAFDFLHHGGNNT